MDRLTVEKIIEINCYKNPLITIDRQHLKQRYDDFINTVDKSYHLRITRWLSECNTPVIGIKNPKDKKSEEIFLYCFGEFYYLKISSEKTIISTFLTSILNEIDNYYYPQIFI